MQVRRLWKTYRSPSKDSKSFDYPVTETLLPLASEWIRFPTQDEADRSKEKFCDKAAFPYMFGCTDGTQKRIQSPVVPLCRCAGNSIGISAAGRPISLRIMFGSVFMADLTTYLVIFFYGSFGPPFNVSWVSGLFPSGQPVFGV